MTAISLINIAISIAIPAAFVYFIFALDLFGTGKGNTVFLSLAWGALGAFPLSFVLNNEVFKPLLGSTEIVRGLSGPIVEEIVKALLLAYLIRQPRFKYLVDGAIYGFATGIGFSVSENIYFTANAPVFDALSRILSATLMHATASALVGIALGRLRRSSKGMQAFGWPALGILLAMGIHILYNNINFALRGGPILLLIAVGFGGVGFLLIGFLMNQGLAEEKERFARTLNASVGVSSNDRRAIQQLGKDAIETVLRELGDMFGEDKVPTIRKLLVTQANIGILSNNLAGPTSERLRTAWTEELTTLRGQMSDLHKQLGSYILTFLRVVFPEKEATWAESFTKQMQTSDPTLVNSYDVFMRAAERAETTDPAQLEATARLLQKAEIFHDVSLADLENLSRAVTIAHFAAGVEIFNEGDEGDTLYLIRQGRIALYRRDNAGREKLLRKVNAGEVVGELALLDGSPRSALARADGNTGEVVALRLRREHFLMFLNSRPQVILAMLKFLANRVRDTTRSLETSMAWVTNVSKGKYDEAKMLGMLAPREDIAVAGEAFPAPNPLEQAPSADTAVAIPLKLGGAFSKVADLLRQREDENSPVSGLWSAALGKKTGEDNSKK